MEKFKNESLIIPLKLSHDENSTINQAYKANEKNKPKISEVFSYLFFTWTTFPLQQSNNNGLKLIDIISNNQKHFSNSKEIYCQLYNQIYPNNLITPDRKSPLLSSLFKVHKFLLLFVLFLSLLQTGFKYLHLILFRQLILLFKIEYNSQGNHSSSNTIYLYSLLFLGNKLFSIFLTNHTQYLSQKLGIVSSNSLSGLIYDKLTRAGSFQGQKYHSVGELINFIQHDAETVNFLFSYGIVTLVVPFQFIMYIYMLFEFFGSTFIFGFITFIILVVVAWIIQKMYIGKQRQLLRNKDERIKLTSNALEILKVIKMYSWEDLFISKINKARESELQSINQILNLSLITGIFHWSIPLFLSVISIGVFTFINGTMAIEDILTATDIFDSMSHPLYRLPIFITSFLNTHISMKRIERFLFEPDEDKYSKPNEDMKRSDRIAIKYVNCDFGIRQYKPGIDKLLLKNVNVEIFEGELVAVLGETGSGKTCFANSIINYIHLLPKPKTENIINGNISYVGQLPWIMNESIRNNILFYNEMDTEKYQEIIDICQLTSDLQSLPAGDLTEVSSNGTNISGGQKARISLARAIYNKADIYIFDDPISSVDSINVDAIFEKALIKYLNNKTRIIIKYDLKYLHRVNRIIYLANGEIKWTGTYEAFIKNTFYQEISTIIQNHNCLNDRQNNRNKAKEDLINKTNIVSISNNLNEKDKLIIEEEQKKGKIDPKLYLSLIKVIGGYLLLSTSIALALLLEGTQIGSTIWLTKWIMEKQDNLYHYLILIQIGLLSLFLLFLKEFLITRGIYNLNVNLHSKILKRLIYAPIHLFHDVVPKGQLLNRLTNDLEKCKIIIKLFSQMLKAITGLIGAFVVCSSFNLYSIIFAPLLLCICLYLARFYSNGGRDFNRIEGIARTPIVEGFSETITGISTIKIFNAAKHFREKFIKHLNNHLMVCLYKYGAMSWYSLNLNLCSFLYLCFILLFSCLYKNSLSPQIIGFLLKYSIKFSDQLLQIIEQATNFEKAMVNFERCDSYTKILQEKPKILSNDVSLFEWPSKGHIKFVNYSTRYRPTTDIVLDNINIEITQGEKIGVVGPSGSGKSSIVQALFRLIEPIKGTIYIDNIDITSIGLKHLRESLCVIPQESTLIEGSLKHNLDPFHQYTDDDIINVLNDLEFFDYIKQGNADVTKVLNYRINESGNNKSLGEKQLICFARSILKKSKIVIFDEATASLDKKCEEIIQKAIHKYFSSCTVISITHKVEVAKTCDRIMVINNGKVVEFDTWNKLIKANGLFSNLYYNNIQST